MKQNNVKQAPVRTNTLSLALGFPPGPPMPSFLPKPSREQEFETAIRHHQAGRMDEAEKVCARILGRNSRDPDALHLRGVMAAQAGRFEDAIKFIARAIEVHPAAAGYYRNLANAFKDNGQIEEAIKTCRQFLRLQPSVAEMHNQLGHLLMGTAKPADAAVSFRDAVRLKPGYAEAWNNLGMALAEVDQVDEAIAAYRQSIALQPMPQTWNNLANVLKATGLRDEAIDGYRLAVSLMPESAEMWNNLGNTLREAGALQESIASLDRAVQLNPELVSAQWNLALALLQNGDLVRGYEKYEWRWQLKEFPSKPPKYGKPKWNGEDIAGKTLLLHVEQGRGDVFQFIRYASLAAERGANVILHCPPEIHRVLRNVPGVNRIVSAEEPFTFDVYASVMSLAHLFGTTLETIPANIPYIHADQELARIWSERFTRDESTAGGNAPAPSPSYSGQRAGVRGGVLSNAGSESVSMPRPSPQPSPLDTGEREPEKSRLLRVGLVWAGSTAHALDKKRSIAFSQVAPLSRVPGIQLYTLQKGDAAEQVANLPEGISLIDRTADLQDFADTAAMISHLDLVIAVDTAVAHLAGAMGKKVWVMLPFSPDWRWMSGRRDSPWYPTMRLFRQKFEGDWTEVIERVMQALAAMQSLI